LRRFCCALVRDAIQLSAQVISTSPAEVVSQLVGRLLARDTDPRIREFNHHARVVAATPWVRPLRAALNPPGTPLTLEGHLVYVSGVAVTPDGKRAVSASSDGTRVTVTPDSRRAVAASWDNKLKVWNPDTGQLIATFHCDSFARCCAFTDKQRIVAGDGGGRVHLLSLEESDSRAAG
jgi:WD40 repeat protein